MLLEAASELIIKKSCNGLDMQVCSEAKTRYDLLPVSSAATPSHSSRPALRRTASVINDCAPTPPEWLPEWNKANHDVTYMSRFVN